MKVAVLGTGKLGGAVARRLAAQGLEVVPWNRTRERAEKLGIGTPVKTPAQAVSETELAISVLTGPDAAAAVYEGEHGVLEAAEGRLLVDMTTGGPDSALRLANAVRDRGGRFLEAPVMGGPPSVEAGKLVILAGGEAADLDAARRVLALLGEIRHVGEVGSANRLKLVSNAMLAGGSALAAELQAAAEHAGVSRDDAFWALQRMMPSLELRRAGYLKQRYQPVLFTLRDMDKDIGLARAIFDGAETPILDASRAVYSEVMESHGDEDLSAVNARYRPRQRGGRS